MNRPAAPAFPIELAKLRLIVFLIAAFASFHVAARGQEQSALQKAQAFYEAGNAATNRRDFEEAIRNFTNAIDLYPTSFEFFYNRAVAYRNLRKYDLAIGDFDKVLELKPNLSYPQLAELLCAKGTVYQEKGDYATALSHLNRAIILSPKNATYYHNRANTYRFMKNYDLALADFNRVLVIMPNALTYYSLAALRNEMGSIDEAISNYSKAIALDPQFGDAFNNRGLCHQKKMSLDSALQDFTKAISLGEKDGVYYFNRANIYVAKVDFPSAVKDYTKAIEIYPMWAEAYRRRANTYRKQGKHNLSAADLRTAIKVQKENFTPVNKIEIY